MKPALVITALILMTAIFLSRTAAAASPDFVVDSFLADYYLGRDSQQNSILSAEEVITVKFPSSGSSSTGIKRLIPTHYLGNDTQLKITSVTDTTGQPIPYRLQNKTPGNLEINIGNPSVTVFGVQSYDIRYQAKGVINFLNGKDEFNPDFNGHGWQEPFLDASAIIHIPNSIASGITAKTCYVNGGKCQLTSRQTDTETVLTTIAHNGLAPNQALAAKIDFKPGTFAAANHNRLLSFLKTAGIVLGIIIGLSAVIAGARAIITLIWRRTNR